MATSRHSGFARPSLNAETSRATTTTFALSTRLARLDRLARHDRHIEASLRTLRRALGIVEESV
jgi:hypothetical protein